MLLTVKKVETKEELTEVYKLRFNIYCKERGFESEEYYPDKLETDEYDPYSVHFIAMLDSEPVGTSRLILHNPIGFPIERYYKINFSQIPVEKDKTAEISRLAISKETFRLLRNHTTRIFYALFSEMYFESKRMGITFFFAAMTRGLYRLLSKCSIKFLQIGTPIEYHGIRAPFFTELQYLEANIFSGNPELSRFISFPDNCIG